ncbi:MAG: type II toxin-antitoxin system RelE/ParE family toxin [Alphaproteobacteria bacterium]|nr:type II toxin-antitoxin system RelE/ParE family toxin [Rhizobiaceae bacterium]MBU3961188.1 type II toxin-antitoxin system RelE/ParE family toxin [Alphaproteobacteria bacterium]MBU4050922.1 type II toxin-antitoxin system RelE/ParE family toxin [Alphaproteobacteria bacterium]MBU4087645.1 type II toxin-antitoxin system RelE/ParE family toxin [Alphaproteobacteria bacterium]MBU4155643.1 type II toxin-antitoxin system RelE/ParE family toxin [Alphaproteobacteria bacterium]
MDELRWTQTAVQDLDDIGSYIAEDSPRSAEAIVRRLVEAAAFLAYYPEIGRLGRVAGTRELVVAGTPYIIVYRVQAAIEILTILHTARKWPDRFD